MRIIEPIIAIVAAATFAGCGASQAGPEGAGGEPVEPSAGGAVDPDEPVSSDEPPGDSPAEPSAGIPCEREIARECGEGLTDGCLLQTPEGEPLTLVHICVPSSETAAPPCEQEIARECDEGLTDACLLTPAPASMHVCVQAE